jgi:chloramphenicol-sensitive protein RarD
VRRKLSRVAILLALAGERSSLLRMSSTRQGVWCAVGAYVLWGVLPVYWKALQTVPAKQILAHRIVWSCVLLAGLVLVRGELRTLRAAAGVRALRIYAAAAVLLAVNWLTYIWAVNAARIVETSLGYFINPLVSVLLGVVFLRERLGRTQWLAVAMAGTGVIYLTWQQGALPWVAVVLASTFGLYGLLKKTAPLGALPGLTLETGLLGLPALAWLLQLEAEGTSAWGHGGLRTTLLLTLTGVVTTLPLLLFASAARCLNLTTIGLLQYISPTCGLLIGVAVYGEPFDRTRWPGFMLIWTALAVYWLEGPWRLRGRRRRTSPPDES